MILKLYAGKSLFAELVQHYSYDKETGKRDKPNVGSVAVPGRKVATESKVREWAKEYGFKVRKVCEPFDTAEEAM